LSLTLSSNNLSNLSSESLPRLGTFSIDAFEKSLSTNAEDGKGALYFKKAFLTAGYLLSMLKFLLESAK